MSHQKYLARLLIQKPQAVLSGGKPSQGAVAVLQVDVDETWNSGIAGQGGSVGIRRLVNYQIKT